MAIYEVPLSNDLLELLTNQGQAIPLGGHRSPSQIGMQKQLDSALSGLTSAERHILWLRFWEHYSFRQIQREMEHKSVSMTHRIYRQALGKLREALNEDA